MRYLDPKNGLTFKRLFGEHPHLCMSLLNSLLPLEPDAQFAHDFMMGGKSPYFRVITDPNDPLYKGRNARPSWYWYFGTGTGNSLW